jgi:uncharacterized membrane protein
MEHAVSEVEGGVGPGSPWGEGLRVRAERRAVGLALVSLGLGSAQLIFPAAMAGFIGVPNRAATRLALRAIGLREVLVGLAALKNPRSSSWALARVLGDVVDLALLQRKMADRRGTRGRLAAATAAVVGIAAVDVASAAKLSRNSSVQKWVGPIHVTRAITIRRPPGDVYAFFRNLENLPRFMEHLESVRYVNGFSVWRAKGPAGVTIEWKAEIVRDRPGEELSWRSAPGTLVPNAGTVRFQPAPRDRGTELVVELKYDPPAGALGAAMAKLFGEEPSWQVASDLRRLKQVLETGEVVQSDASRGRGRTPARPSIPGATEQKESAS